MRNIIITGGELFNKGAQAMTYLTVSALKKQFPNHNIYLLSELDFARSKQERHQYAFRFMGWYPPKFAKAQNNPILRLLCQIKNRNEFREANSIYKNTDFMVDISGYGLGAVWSVEVCNNYLNHIEFAKSYNIPMYLLPQSFGPFDFKGDEGAELFSRCKELLPYAKVIFAREQEGYDALVSNFGLTNVQLAKDLVLCGGEPDLSAIFTDPRLPDLPVLKKNAVGIIPNQRNTVISGDASFLQKTYISLIEHLLPQGKEIYLLCHSTHDIELCRNLKDAFANNPSVVYLDHEFSCLEFNELVKGFDYLVASRFHSIVHAYKNGIPCIALGWADKYRQLLDIFDQSHYLFDVRNTIDLAVLTDAVDTLNQSRDKESLIIREKLPALRAQDVFRSLSFT